MLTNAAHMRFPPHLANTPHTTGSSGRCVDYYVSDGVYGSFNCILYDHPELHPHVLHMTSDANATPAPGTVFGPTCDGADKVLDNVLLPAMQPGDWLLFPNMGAYTIAGACNFNGFDAIGARRFYVYSCD